ncbi:MAG TPA: low molecular weight phosphotyrosine protein phosphatase, partial [Ramlibacter sp.]
MAAGLLRSRLPRLAVDSAGLGALLGQPADPAAIELLRQRDVDIADHRATQVTRQACLAADLVLVMDREQRARLQALYPEVHG